MKEPDVSKHGIVGDAVVLPSRLFSRLFKKDREVLRTFLLFSISILMGIVLKFWLGSFVTMGYDDYRAQSAQGTLSLVELQTKVLGQGGSLAYVPQLIGGPACRQDDVSTLHP